MDAADSGFDRIHRIRHSKTVVIVRMKIEGSPWKAFLHVHHTLIYLIR